jgi:undecaprenyl-diphosphatase
VTILQAVVLGIVQGITEWLPISSTAHLVLVPWLFGWTIDPAVRTPFLVLVQDGTLLAVLVYFRRDLLGITRALLAGIRDRAPLRTPESRLGWWLLLGTVPAVVAGLTLHRWIEALHGKPVVVAAVLLLATPILFAGERWGRRDRSTRDLGVRDALGIGMAQAVALLPGVSRSAATIGGGMLAGLGRPESARFSFLLSVPVMAAAGAKEAWDLARGPALGEHLPAIAAGFLAAAVVGYAAIHWLLGYLARHPLTAFAWYRVGAGLLLLALALGR